MLDDDDGGDDVSGSFVKADVLELICISDDDGLVLSKRNNLSEPVVITRRFR
jgi:hypothetical protein